MAARRAVVIGGGLAGMTVALELAKHGMPVHLIEAADQLGGKAKASQWNGGWEDHGYHIFPAWYVNTRRLLAEIGCAANLVDLHCVNHLQRGGFPTYIRMFEPTMRHNIANIRKMAKEIGWSQTILSHYFLVDLGAERLSNDASLDRISVTGYMRSRFYATNDLAIRHHQQLLQASSVEGYECSAKTMQNVILAWLRTPTPFSSILNGNLTEKFIAPFARHLQQQAAPVTVQTGWTVVHVDVKDGRVCGLQLRQSEVPGPEGGMALPEASADDFYVLATPPEATLKLVDTELLRTELRSFKDPLDGRRGLADLVFLRSVPMAALHVHFTRRLTDIPSEHVSLDASRFCLGFIDVSQHWQGLDHTVLNLIASDFAPLSQLAQYRATLMLLRELREYIPFTNEDLGVTFDIDNDNLSPQEQAQLNQRCFLQSHVDTPLFLNTVGAWHFRPTPRTGIPNLFAAGDYCRSGADLTTMESAVMSGLGAAHEILTDARIGSHVTVLEIPRVPKGWLRAVKWGLIPVIYPMGLRKHLSDRRRIRRQGLDRLS